MYKIYCHCEDEGQSNLPVVTLIFTYVHFVLTQNEPKGQNDLLGNCKAPFANKSCFRFILQV